jgi:hypothetical protein
LCGPSSGCPDSFFKHFSKLSGCQALKRWSCCP